ncbi:fluoride efflux transporter CrcB [Paenalkalicoccus suaedae]|uniref:Fluoride-specific ion channel FluC n=1 Tax=Paenalkalicoccus suaedae TaxID=2592382 RepID=A0A859FB01_9BACI|nr:fluoride efflux transporter CrcB [Paenalkalicoccus suaedae]QKS69968.1 fluoride efflux transporter CrcB [Paenalkalicoccus suaedae]
MTFLLVALGGAIGAVARYLLGLRFAKVYLFSTIPLAIFIVNCIGSFLLGLMTVLFLESPSLFLLLGVGLCGAFTTFSTFSVEVVQLLRASKWSAAVVHVLITMVGVLLSFLTGVWLVGI